MHFENVGYEGRNGWYVNTQAIQKGLPVDVYAGFKKPNVVAAMNSVVQNTEGYMKNCSGNKTYAKMELAHTLALFAKFYLWKIVCGQHELRKGLVATSSSRAWNELRFNGLVTII